jgi:hypothetical protein
VRERKRARVDEVAVPVARVRLDEGGRAVPVRAHAGTAAPWLGTHAPPPPLPLPLPPPVQRPLPPPRLSAAAAAAVRGPPPPPLPPPMVRGVRQRSLRPDPAHDDADGYYIVRPDDEITPRCPCASPSSSSSSALSLSRARAFSLPCA